MINDFPKGKIYLAGPFFTYAQRWLIDQIRTILHSMGLTVFSPWHDIGHGIASEVVSKDLEGLEQSQLVFAIIDGLDSGTLFEVGYAVKNGIPVIAYVQNETEESVKMLEGTGCVLEKDLTTAIYKSYWHLGKNA
jgi:nucleoside 2-deoxyribosyltransferase